MRGPSRRVSQDKNSELISNKKMTRSLKTLYRASKNVNNLETQKHTVII